MKFNLITLRWLLVGLTLLFLVWLLRPTIGTARYAARRNACSDQLRKIYAALDAYVKSEGKLPTDATGSFSLMPLLALNGASPEHIDASWLHCPGDLTPADISYLTNSKLTLDEFHQPKTPVLCDRAGNHVAISIVLFADGHVQPFEPDVDRTKWDDWCRRFENGEIREFSARD